MKGIKHRIVLIYEHNIVIKLMLPGLLIFSLDILCLQPSPNPRSPVPRIPSPQELIVHTQAIMQNALLKRQLEDQKERFFKKQHDT